MFENIIGQQKIVSQLTVDCRGGRIPGAMLFYGDAYAGKLSTALELSRVLTCRKGGDWSCDCDSCRRHRVLDHPYVLMLGTRYFIEEIAASGDALGSSRTEGARYLFIRAVRKLTRRFDPLLWEGNEQKIKKVQTQLAALEEELDSLYPEVPIPEDTKLRDTIEKITGLCIELSRTVPRDNIPIDQVRAVNTWVHTTSATSPKIIIFENAEKMGASSRNALLKTLEEPPEGAYFILLSTRRGRIMPTILSRVRQYHFPGRDAGSTTAILEKIFRIHDPQYNDLRSFFLAWRGVPLEKLHAQAEHFFSYVWAESEWEPEKLEEFLNDKNLSLYFVPFLEELSRKILLYMRDSEKGRRVSYSLLERWNGELRDSLRQFEHMNQAPDLLLERLLYRMKESV